MFSPPPPAPKTTTPQIEPPTLPEPPKIEGDPSASLPPVPATIPEAPEPAKPKPPPRKGSVAAAPPKTTPPTQTADQTPAPPKLGQIFTPDQSRAYNRAIDESLDRVRRALAVLSAKSLNSEQNEKLNQIRTFEKQAEQARPQDLVAAALLAHRADVLAQDLLQRVP
jgi:hypothetical protein